MGDVKERLKVNVYIKSYANLIKIMPIGLINLHMSKNEPNTDPGDNKPMSNYAKFSGLAFQMIAIIGGLAYAGYKIDESAGHTTKWVTAMLALIGVFISLYIVIKSVKS